jgi:hypothetical protein
MVHSRVCVIRSSSVNLCSRITSDRIIELSIPLSTLPPEGDVGSALGSVRDNDVDFTSVRALYPSKLHAEQGSHLT